MEEIHIINGKEVHFKPAGTKRVLSEAVMYYLSALIPQGRLAIKFTVWDFLAEQLGVHHVEFEPELWDKKDNIDIVLELNKTYKLLSDRGRVDKIHVDKLREEGFEFEPATKYMVKVKNYKNFLFDFAKETKIDATFIERINKIGYASLNELK